VITNLKDLLSLKPHKLLINHPLVQCRILPAIA